MANGIDGNKGSPANVALRVFDGMEQGVIDITTDAFSDHFVDWLKKDLRVIEAFRKEFKRED